MSLRANGDYTVKDADLARCKSQRRFLVVAVACLTLICIGLFIGLLLVGVKVTHPQEELYCLTSACTISAAEIMHAFNRSQDPCEDFYEYVCGNDAPPEGNSYYNAQFYRTTNKITAKMAPLLYKTNLNKTVPEAIEKEVRLMQVCVNFTTMKDEKNLKHLREFVQEFGGWPLATQGKWDPRRQLPIHRLMATLIQKGYPPQLFMFLIGEDAKQPGKLTIMLDQPSESLLESMSKSDRELDLTPEEKTKADNIRLYAGWLGNNDTKAIDSAIDEIMKLKRDITKNLGPRNERNNDELMYNKMTIRELQRITENKIEWLEILNEVFSGILELQDTEEIIVREVEYLKKLPTLMKKYEDRILTNFMIANVLSSVIDEVDSESSILRLNHCYEWINTNMYFATTRLYLKTYFKEENKAVTKTLIDEIKDAYRDTIEHTLWMDNETRSTAMKKIESMKEVIAYPEWIMNDQELNDHYDYVTVTDNHFINVITINQNATTTSLKLLREPYDVNRSTDLNPTEVNAYYSPELNKIMIPAAILQPPFIEVDYIQAKNFGALGSIIGHEIGHGFDSRGRMHDENGILRQWWSNESLNAFEDKTECFINQYNQYCPKEHQHDPENYPCVDGNYTLTENMADNSGLRQAYKAYKTWTQKNGKLKRLPGLTEFSTDQIFFISFADIWCSTLRDGYYKSVYGDNLHAASQYRVIGPLSNFPEFAKAFNCPPGPMNRQEESCSLWT